PAQHNGVLPFQHARMEQLREHALDAIRVFAHVFQKENPAIDLRKKWSAQQGGKHRKVAAPQYSPRIHTIGIGRLEAQYLELVTHDLGEQVGRQIVHGFLAEVRYRRWARIAHGAGTRQQGEVERSEVAVTHEDLAAVGHG